MAEVNRKLMSVDPKFILMMDEIKLNINKQLPVQVSGRVMTKVLSKRRADIEPIILNGFGIKVAKYKKK